MRTRPPHVRANSSLGEPFDRHLVILGFIQREKEGIRSFILSERSLRGGLPTPSCKDTSGGEVVGRGGGLALCLSPLS